jgi:hypothetical protein
MGRRKKNDPRNNIDKAEVLLRTRLENCHTVVSHLESCPAWEIIVKDLLANKQYIDDNWQDIVDDKKLQRARELKNSYKHLLDIKEKYQEELNSYKEFNEKMGKRDKEFIKDYDSEGVSADEEGKG